MGRVRVRAAPLLGWNDGLPFGSPRHQGPPSDYIVASCASSFARPWGKLIAEARSWELRHPLSPVLAKDCARLDEQTPPW